MQIDWPIIARPLDGEALWSWLTRVGAPFELSPQDVFEEIVVVEDGDGKIRYQNTITPQTPFSARDHRILAHKTAVDIKILRKMSFGQRHEANMQGWIRQDHVWCPECVANDIMERGETYGRLRWAFAGEVICIRHRRFLTKWCHRCHRHGIFFRFKGRQRVMCSRCHALLDEDTYLRGGDNLGNTVDEPAADDPLWDLLAWGQRLLATLAAWPDAPWRRAGQLVTRGSLKAFHRVHLLLFREVSLNSYGRRIIRTLDLSMQPEDYSPNDLVPMVAAAPYFLRAADIRYLFRRPSCGWYAKQRLA
ncbi:TniQ family protein [Acetobacter sicerae]|uniref:TniQ family protein n=1 Tax=Acetobacter sicerae TaxID=85325 RepID=UPI00156AEF78|nr:hypothetical protein [Acetobacter sicerae]